MQSYMQLYFRNHPVFNHSSSTAALSGNPTRAISSQGANISRSCSASSPMVGWVSLRAKDLSVRLHGRADRLSETQLPSRVAFRNLQVRPSAQWKIMDTRNACGQRWCARSYKITTICIWDATFPSLPTCSRLSAQTRSGRSGWTSPHANAPRLSSDAVLPMTRGRLGL